MSLQDRPDRRRGDPDLELQQLPADPLVAPPRVLPAEADDEVPDFGLDRRPAGVTPPPICPLLPDEFPIPAGAGSPAAPRTRTSCSSSSPSPPPTGPGRDGGVEGASPAAAAPSPGAGAPGARSGGRDELAPAAALRPAKLDEHRPGCVGDRSLTGLLDHPDDRRLGRVAVQPDRRLKPVEQPAVCVEPT